jgi:hypothetical protein
MGDFAAEPGAGLRGGGGDVDKTAIRTRTRCITIRPPGGSMPPASGVNGAIGQSPAGGRTSVRDRLEAVAFICGCGHTGTTLLANILAAHPDIYVPLRETAAFCGHRWRARRTAAALLDEAVHSGRAVLVEKTPRHIRHLGRIRAWAPGARLVMPVRDGRDVVASLKERHGDARAGERRWVEETGIVADQLGKPDSLIYRYEDLVEDPERLVGKVCAFIGVEFRREIMDYHRTQRLWFGETKLRGDAGRTGEADQNARRNWQVNQPIVDRRGRWRGRITEADFPRLLSGRGLRLMTLFGYL